MKLTPTTKRVAVGLLAAALPLSMAACTKGASSSSGGAGGELTLWTHNAGNKAELGVDHGDRQRLQRQPEQVQGQGPGVPAGLLQRVRRRGRGDAKKLPCILDIDGPNVPNWAWAGYLAPLDGHGRHAVEVPADRRSASTTTRCTRSATTTSRSAMFARKSVLDKYGIRIPTIDQPWTEDEFDAALAKIKASGKFAEPARPRDRRHRRVVALRVLAVPAELRRRPDRPQRLQDAPRACSTAPRRWRGRPGSGAWSPRATCRRSPARTRPADFINGKTAIIWTGTLERPRHRARLRRRRRCSCRRRTSATARRSAAARGSGACSQNCSDHGRRAGLPEVRRAGQVRRERRDGIGHHPGHRRGRGAWSRATRRAGENEIFLDVRRRSSPWCGPSTPGYPFIATDVREGGAGHPHRR